MINREERERRRKKLNAVRDLMLDGNWHGAAEIRAVGGSEGLRRLRELREGGCAIAKAHVGDGMYEYLVINAYLFR